MLKLLSVIALVLGAVALLGGAIVVYDAQPSWRTDRWDLLRLGIGLQMLASGALTLLLGAIGLGVHDLRARAELASKQTSWEMSQRLAELTIAVEIAPQRAQLVAEHGEAVAADAVARIVQARREKRAMTLAEAVTKAKEADATRAREAARQVEAADAFRARMFPGTRDSNLTG